MIGYTTCLESGQFILVSVAKVCGYAPARDLTKCQNCLAPTISLAAKYMLGRNKDRNR